MWFTKKRIYKQIDEYGIDTDVLLEVANFLLKTDACDITLTDMRAYYEKFIMSDASEFRRMFKMKAIRKWFRHMSQRGELCLRASDIGDNPFLTVEKSVILTSMQKKVMGRPRNEEIRKKVKILKEEGGLSVREIGKALNKDFSQVARWYRDTKKEEVGSVELSTDQN